MSAFIDGIPAVGDSIMRFLPILIAAIVIAVGLILFAILRGRRRSGASPTDDGPRRPTGTREREDARFIAAQKKSASRRPGGTQPREGQRRAQGYDRHSGQGGSKGGPHSNGRGGDPGYRGRHSK